MGLFKVVQLLSSVSERYNEDVVMLHGGAYHPIEF